MFYKNFRKIFKKLRKLRIKFSKQFEIILEKAIF